MQDRWYSNIGILEQLKDNDDGILSFNYQIEKIRTTTSSSQLSKYHIQKIWVSFLLNYGYIN